MAFDFYYLAALPAALLVFYLAMFSIDKLLYLTVFLVPISLPLQEFVPSLSFDMQLPTEPILVVLTLLFIFKLIQEHGFDRRILLHPVTLAIIFNIAWIFFTSLTSTMPLVSFKFMISRLWFVIPFYFIASQLFVKKRNMRNYVWAYIPLLLVVIGYAVYRLSQFGFFDQQLAHKASSPFFRDHTSYGAILAMLLPFMLGFALNRIYTLPFRILCWIVIFILCFALVFSYTRAAWISILVATGVYLLFIVKIKLRTIAIFAGIFFAVFMYYRTDIMMELKSNRQDSSKDMMKHVRSMANISTDASNMERINRWHSAFKMIEEKPVLGWGPGTYQFQYAPFQLSKDKTIISTNRGDGGNAHSEYIGACAESGFIGSISLILIMFLTILTAYKIYIKPDTGQQVRTLILSASLGLITYYTHGLLNNFLDTDKASVLFWGFTAMIVALDVYHKEEEGEKAVY
jgi:O-antigen ligase